MWMEVRLALKLSVEAFQKLWNIFYFTAYGGNAFILPEMRYLKKGMEYVDSFEVNPNKLLMTAFDCTCMWVKNLLTFAAAFAVDPV